MLISGCGQTFAHALRCPTSSIAPATPLIMVTHDGKYWYVQIFIAKLHYVLVYQGRRNRGGRGGLSPPHFGNRGG